MFWPLHHLEIMHISLFRPLLCLNSNAAGAMSALLFVSRHHVTKISRPKPYVWFLALCSPKCRSSHIYVNLSQVLSLRLIKLNIEAFEVVFYAVWIKMQIPDVLVRLLSKCHSPRRMLGLYCLKTELCLWPLLCPYSKDGSILRMHYFSPPILSKTQITITRVNLCLSASGSRSWDLETSARSSNIIWLCSSALRCANATLAVFDPNSSATWDNNIQIADFYFVWSSPSKCSRARDYVCFPARCSDQTCRTYAALVLSSPASLMPPKPRNSDTMSAPFSQKYQASIHVLSASDYSSF